MWWGIGIVGFAIIAFAFMKFRAASHHVQLVNAARNHIYLSFRNFNILDRELDERVWHDPYLLGYAQGSVAIMTELYAGNRTTTQKGMIFLDALKGLLPHDYEEVCDRIALLSRQREPDFQHGMEHGANVALLISGRPTQELLADPDVHLALRQGPATAQVAEQIYGEGDGNAYAGAGAALMRLYLSRHKKHGGY